MTADRKIRDDLAFIRNVIESSTTYNNIPASGYVVAGCLGICACLLTYGRLGSEGLARIGEIETGALGFLAVVWGGAFLLALLAVLCLSIRNARKHGLPGWNALTARLFLSQVPVVVAAGVFTVALTIRGGYGLIPALWLLCYGVIVFSFSYYTGIEHRIQGFVFLFFGIWSSFASGGCALILLGAGFGVVNIVFGTLRCCKLIGKHGTQETG